MKLKVILLAFLAFTGQANADDMWTGMYEREIVNARNGNTDSQFNVAGMYKNGQGTKSDREKALYWYTRAAEQGHEKARAAITLMQANKRRFSKTRTAAESGKMEAEYKLASMYESGKGTDIDLKQARHWYGIAADKGHAKAQYGLARIHYDNRKNSSDGKTAFRWFLEAAEQGYSPAQYYLAKMYLQGRDVKKNPKQALDWYRKAAEGGYGPAYKGITLAEEALDRSRKNAARAKEEALVNAMLSAEEEHARAVTRSAKTKSASRTAGKTVTKKRKKSAASKPAVTAASMKKIILNGEWQRGKAPAMFLPSRVNKCTDEKTRLVCASGDLNPTGDGSSRYRVKSIITGIDANGSFTVVFRRLDLGSVIDTDWTDEDNSSSTTSGGWSAAMNLQCKLKKGLSIACQNSLGRTTEFTRSSRTARR